MEDFTTSQGDLDHCSAIHTVKNCFLRFRQTLLYSSLCPLPLVLSLGATEKKPDLASLRNLLLLVLVYIDKIPPEPSLIQAEQSQLLQLFLVDGML